MKSQRTIYPYELCNTKEKRQFYSQKWREEKEYEFMDAWYTSVYGGELQIPGAGLVSMIYGSIKRSILRRRFNSNQPLAA